MQDCPVKSLTILRNAALQLIERAAARRSRDHKTHRAILITMLPFVATMAADDFGAQRRHNSLIGSTRQWTELRIRHPGS